MHMDVGNNVTGCIFLYIKLVAALQESDITSYA